MSIALFCDFDETITQINVTDTVLERFADPLWLEIQEDWLAGRLGAREVLEKQMPLITVDPGELDSLIDAIDIDPFFAEFASLCNERGDSLYILSDGFDYWIDKILRRALSAREGLAEKIGVFACGLELRQNRAAISFPYFPEGCIHGCATCKPALFDRLRAGADKAVVVGDGVSDLLLARKADLVLAKNGLGEFCRREGIAFSPFNSFHDVTEVVGGFQYSLEQR